MRSDSAQFFSARALRRSSRTISMTPSRAFSTLPDLAGAAGGLFVTKAQDTVHDVVEKLPEGGLVGLRQFPAIDHLHGLEQMRDGDRRIQVVAEGVVDVLDEGLYLRGGRFLDFARNDRLPCAQLPTSLHQALVALFGGSEGFVGEVQGAAVMGLEDEEADGHRAVGAVQFGMVAAEQLRQGDEVPEGLAHLLPVDGDHVVMDPVMHALGTAGGLVLRDLALMVREHQVHAASMDVELLAEVLLPHHGALEVPAREAFTPRGGPAHDVLRLGFLPDGEVVRSYGARLSDWPSRVRVPSRVASRVRPDSTP